MSVNNMPSSQKIHIGFFGVRNSGKSSLVNVLANQEVSVVSDVLGTTTDNVKKSMELQPVGPVILVDTPGIDDEGSLGLKRIEQSKKILRSCDVAVLVTTSVNELNQAEKSLVNDLNKRKTPYIIVKNKCDIMNYSNADKDAVWVSAKEHIGIEDLKEKLVETIKSLNKKEIHFIADFIEEKDIVILVTPIDKGAPKGRLILPQQLAIYEIAKENAVSIVTSPNELGNVLNSLKQNPKLVITDSQVFDIVEKIVPKEIILTSFSILMARYKGFLETSIKGVQKMHNLVDGSKVLICEGCTHHRQCDDIGTKKIPDLIKNFIKKEINFEWTSGGEFPKELKKYDLIVHCGGCMLNDKEMEYRRDFAILNGIAFTNYGILIAYINGILTRAIEIIPTLHNT